MYEFHGDFGALQLVNRLVDGLQPPAVLRAKVQAVIGTANVAQGCLRRCLPCRTSTPLTTLAPACTDSVDL